MSLNPRMFLVCEYHPISPKKNEGPNAATASYLLNFQICASVNEIMKQKNKRVKRDRFIRISLLLYANI